MGTGVSIQTPHTIWPSKSRPIITFFLYQQKLYFIPVWVPEALSSSDFNFNQQFWIKLLVTKPAKTKNGKYKMTCSLAQSRLKKQKYWGGRVAANDIF